MYIYLYWRNAVKPESAKSLSWQWYFISMHMTDPRFYIGCSRTSVCKVLMNFLSFGFIMSWVIANFNKYKILKFMYIKISDEIKFLNRIYFSRIYFFSIKNFKVGQTICCNLQE